jgi:hypothetical protein
MGKPMNIEAKKYGEKIAPGGAPPGAIFHTILEASFPLFPNIIFPNIKIIA